MTLTKLAITHTLVLFIETYNFVKGNLVLFLEKKKSYHMGIRGLSEKFVDTYD